MEGVTAAATQLSHSPQATEELLRENTALRARLSLSDEQRVTQEVLRDQLQQFFQRAAEEERASQEALRDSTQIDEENATEDVGAPSRVSAALPPAVSAVLRHMQLGRQQAEEALERLQSETVAPLHAQLEAAETEKRQLVSRIADLEMSMASTPAPPLVAELQQLRASEALLRHQLQEAQEAAVGTVGTFCKSVEGGLAAANRVPELIGKMEALKEEVRVSYNVQAAQRVLLEELDRRHGVEREIENAFHKEETTMLRERIGHLEAEVRAAAAREAAVVAERDAKDLQLISVQNQMKELIQQHSEEQQALAQKRQRAEQDASSNPSSIRGELTKFWYEGRDQIRDLERQVRTLHYTQADLRVSQGRVAQLEQRKAVLAGNLAELAAEVDRRRSEERDLRAHCAGVEAERDRLLTSVAMTVGRVMSEGELRECCDTIRAAATRVAATSATVVADPHAIEEALRRSQRLKSEVAQLQRQKDQLQRFLQLREDRVRALMEQEALLQCEPQQRELTSSAVLPRPSSAGSAAPFSLPLFLEYIRQGANDVFLLNEMSAARAVGGAGAKKAPVKGTAGGSETASFVDSSVAPHRNSFVALQQQFQQSQERLLASQRELLETRSENRRLQSELEGSRSDHTAAVASQEEARRAVEAANAALTNRTITLTSELQEMHQHYTAAVGMVRTTLEGLCSTLELYHQSEQHAEKLREMVQAERRDMSDLLRREAASWGAGDGSGGTGSAQEAQHAAAAEKITVALQRMEAYIAEAIQQTALQASQDQTNYIGQLVLAIREQEERVKDAKAAFEAAAQAQASSLAERISAAQQQWESTWKAKYQAIESERTQSLMQQRASVVLQRALEQAVAPPAAVGSSSSSSTEAALAVTEEVTESSAQMAGTLQTIRSFITHARQRQEQQQREELLRQQQIEQQRQIEEQQQLKQQRQKEEEEQRQQLEEQRLKEQAAATPPPPQPLSPPVAATSPASEVSGTSPLTPASPAPSLVSNVAPPESLPETTVPAAAPIAGEAEEPGASNEQEEIAGSAAENEEAGEEVKQEPSSASTESRMEQEAPEEDEQQPPQPEEEPAAADVKEEPGLEAEEEQPLADEEVPPPDTSSPE